MNFNESVDYLYSLGNEMLAMKLGLDSIRLLARSIGDPQNAYPAIHIAGTNGKGSTAAMIESILRAAGSRTGLFTSPHLVEITERIRVAGLEISREEFARAATEVRRASEDLAARGELESVPTFFEQVTAIAYLHFKGEKVDHAILEVGMGGHLDATNICRPAVTAITPIGLDHQRYLGETLAMIAAEKAGILKPGVPVIVAPQKPEAMRVIKDRAAEIGAPLICVSEAIAGSKLDLAPADDSGRYRVSYDTGGRYYRFTLNLRGRHQVTNAVTAIHIAESPADSGFEVTQPAIEKGLSEVIWPGRLELIQYKDTPLLIDGAHNRAGLETLRDFLIEHYHDTPITLIFGVMADKDIAGMGEVIFPVAEKIIAVKVSNPRAADPEVIVAAARSNGKECQVAGDAGEALEMAAGEVSPGGMICACGSLYLAGEIKERTRNTLNKQNTRK